jgi:hypothetical protein
MDPPWHECSRAEDGFPDDDDGFGAEVHNSSYWAVITGPEFGCVLWEAKEPRA